jgi:GTP-binding protein
MVIRSVEFRQSSVDIKGCPSTELPEFAFIGRSNVGKSSLINMITGKKDLAKVSGKPGKTRTINHFLVDDQWYLVDLPGYGFAKISKTEREKIQKMIAGYLLKRQNLFCTFLLIDSRLEPQKLDTDFIHWMGDNSVPFAILFTKIDKLSAAGKKRCMDSYRRILSEEWEELPMMIPTSAETKAGKDETLKWIGSLLTSVKPG